MIYGILRGQFGTVSELIFRNSLNFSISIMIKGLFSFNLHEMREFSTHRIIIREKLNSTLLYTHVNVSNIYIIFKNFGTFILWHSDFFLHSKGYLLPF